MLQATAVPAPINDPWAADDGFTNIDMRKGPEHFAEELGKIAEQEPQFAPSAEEVAAADPAPAPLAAEIVSSYAPKVHTMEDGSTVTVERTTNGYKATLTQGKNSGSGAEVFEDATESGLLQKVLISKIHASKKIRELNKQVKLARPVAPPQAPAGVAGKKNLTPDELFDYKAQLAANPDLANERWFQMKTGMSLESLVGLAKLGAKAAEEIRAESEARAFKQARPEYYATDDNLSALISYIEKHNYDFVAPKLVEAFDELTEAGLLEQAPQAQPIQTAAAPVTPAAPSPTPAAAVPVEGKTEADERIVRTVRRPRASYGLRGSDTTVVPATAPLADREPSVEELDNLSDKDIDDIFANIRRDRARSARR